MRVNPSLSLYSVPLSGGFLLAGESDTCRVVDRTEAVARLYVAQMHDGSDTGPR